MAVADRSGRSPSPGFFTSKTRCGSPASGPCSCSSSWPLLLLLRFRHRPHVGGGIRRPVLRRMQGRPAIDLTESRFTLMPDLPAPILPSLTRHLWSPHARQTGLEVYAILDGARNAAIYPAVTHTRLPHTCLYRGELAPVLAQAAPHLVQLIRDTPFTSWLLREGWGDHWGVFFTSATSLQRLRSHFRRFLRVKDETGRTLYFRFYDPRVLRAYLPTCTKAELEFVFGPVECFHVEAENAATVLDFARLDLGLPSTVSS